MRTSYFATGLFLLALSSCKRELPELRDGDVIFQESSSRQSEMVRALTRSRWTHLGVVFREARGYVVLEAVSPVKYTPLATFIARGRGERFVVKRLNAPFDASKLRQVGKTMLGRPYDLKFRWDDGSLYCSELVYKLFDRALALRLGQVQRAHEMNLSDERVQRALKARFAGRSFDPNEQVITPDSIFNDAQLTEVYR